MKSIHRDTIRIGDSLRDLITYLTPATAIGRITEAIRSRRLGNREEGRPHLRRQEAAGFLSSQDCRQRISKDGRRLRREIYHL